MKKILLVTAFTLISCLLFAQENTNSNTKSNSKWKTTIDGKSYQMEASSSGSSAKKTQKSHITFSIKGSDSNLTKITLIGEKLNLSVPISNEAQPINVAAGHYKFKFYHSKLGVQEFEVDLKNGGDRAIILTLK